MLSKMLIRTIGINWWLITGLSLKMIKFAINNEQYTFILTKVGCGLAGYPYAEDMYMCFLEDIEHELDLPKLPMNIIFPADFTNNLNYPPEF